MRLDSVRRLASKKLNVGKSRVFIDPEKVKDAQSAITGEDINSLITDGVIKKSIAPAQSRGRARILAQKKKKGRKRGQGKRKGTLKARVDTHAEWMIKVRSQRKYIRELKTQEKIDPKLYRELYRKVKGGFFRSKKHIDVYVEKLE